jgi:hypothetical protein
VTLLASLGEAAYSIHTLITFHFIAWVMFFCAIMGERFSAQSIADYRFYY